MCPNSMNSDINKIASLVSSQLKILDDSIIIKPDHFDWNRIKRTPQYFKQKIKFNGGSYTVDESFNDLENELNNEEKTIKSLIKYVKPFGQSMIQLLEISKEISDGFQDLIDPYNKLITEGNVDEHEYEAWNRIHEYKNVVKLINVENDVKEVMNIIENKLEECLKIIKTIQKKISIRQYALLDYDKVYNNHESLLLKQEQGDLTLKQTNQLYSLKRKTEENKLKYDEINNILKIELPYFFKLMQLIIEPIQVMVYFVYLIYVYQTSSNLEPFYKITGDIKQLVDDFEIQNKPIVAEIEKFSIINFQSQFLKDLLTTENNETGSQYCHAIFNFQGQEKSDLSIQKGDTIKILEREGEWWKGELDGKVGYFPSNYVRLL